MIFYHTPTTTSNNLNKIIFRKSLRESTYIVYPQRDLWLFYVENFLQVQFSQTDTFLFLALHYLLREPY